MDESTLMPQSQSHVPVGWLHLDTWCPQRLQEAIAQNRKYVFTAPHIRMCLWMSVWSSEGPTAQPTLL